MQPMTARLDAKGRVMPPKRLRDLLALKPGHAVLLAWESDILSVLPVTAPLGDDLAGALPGLIDARGRISLPRLVREALGLKPGALLLLRLAPAGLEMATADALLRRQREARLALQALT